MDSSGPASVIIGTYNDANIIENTLAAFAVQSFRNFELILADDGSDQDYAPVLTAWAPRFAHGIQHVTQQKHGFRKARVLNRAVMVSRFDPLIVSDMDCLPHRDFVRNHLAYVTLGTAITGRRTHVSRDIVPSPEKILESGLGFGPSALIGLRLRGKARIIEHGLVSPILYESHNRRLHGSNFSVCRQDIAEVNGWNEEFEGWGDEDSDLGARLQHSGVRIRNLRNKVIQFHLLHDRLPMVNPQNEALFERTRVERTTRARIGIAESNAADFIVCRYGVAVESAPVT
jgi:cellulose synthase/poly-beta-1,6-N-acetylglucosamine synthase-like glycosyltransferase